ncbi:MAG: prepilin-type N-terminal cleavage/methylation domain-containing protein, partial [Armatimonadota bacterium]|nr:prepilin-type N-terminal cleavage/methylation domain-containing protein [Armatimonadota bacterium]
MHQSVRQTNLRNAFTLIELLVVIAIIAILAAI